MSELAPSPGPSGAEPELFAEDLAHVVDHARDALGALRGARIFITGGTGFFGRWLIESFLAANRAFALGAEAVVLTRDPEGASRRIPHAANDPSISLLRGDVRDFEFPPFRPTHIIHGATSASAALNEQRPEEMLATIVDGTRRTMEYARRSGAQRVLFISSGAVYGVQPPSLQCVPEEFAGAPDPLDARQAYAEGKRMAELVATLAALAAGSELTVARCFAFVGPGLPLDAHFAIGNFIRDALRGGPIRITGDGTPFRSYQYPADLAIWLWTILVTGRPGRAYNVGSDSAIALGDLAALVASLSSPPCDVIRARTPDPAIPAPRYVPCVSRARNELGLRVLIDLPDAIRRTLRWHERMSTPDEHAA